MTTMTATDDAIHVYFTIDADDQTKEHDVHEEFLRAMDGLFSRTFRAYNEGYKKSGLLLCSIVLDVEELPKFYGYIERNSIDDHLIFPCCNGVVGNFEVAKHPGMNVSMVLKEYLDDQGLFY